MPLKISPKRITTAAIATTTITTAEKKEKTGRPHPAVDRNIRGIFCVKHARHQCSILQSHSWVPLQSHLAGGSSFEIEIQSNTPGRRALHDSLS